MKRSDSRAVGALPPSAKLILLCCLFITMLAALCVGRMMVSPGEVWNAVIGHLSGEIPDKQIHAVVWNIRLPRILLAALVGGGLSAAGCAFQSLFSNPLAAPDTVGVASGASFGAVLGILFGFRLIGTQLISLLGGLLAVALTALTGYRRDRNKTSIILAGIMIGSLFSALVSLVKYVADADTKLPVITYWLMGSLDSSNYASLRLGAPFILGGILILLTLRWRMNLLPLSDDEAKASGVNLSLLRGLTILAAAAITASSVSMCGQVGWVGLIVPHICRMRFGNNHMALMPSSILLGASFLIIVDTIARSATAASIPISILTAIIGAPFFILLIQRSKGWQLS